MVLMVKSQHHLKWELTEMPLNHKLLILFVLTKFVKNGRVFLRNSVK